MTPWMERHYAVVDVEGNGHHPPDLVELGVLPITDGQIGEPTAWLFKPEEPVTAMARRIHGISNEAVAAAPVFAELADEVRARLDGVVLVAHNAHIDLAVLKRQLPGFAPAEVVDTLKLSRRFLPEQPSHRLGALVEALGLDDGLPPGLAAHRATYDVLATAQLFVYLANGTDDQPRSFEELRDGPGDHDDTLF
jgi:DNA polymerase III epsilon subunit-like protein